MEAFAAASGDRSPLHTDPEFGRRTAFGQCIVYGGLESIALLGLLPEATQRRVSSVRSVFPGAALVSTPYTARALTRPGLGEEWELQLSGRGRVLARVSVSLGGQLPRVLDRERLLAAAGTAVAPAAAEGLVEGLVLGGEYRPGPDLAGLAQRLGAGGLPTSILDGIAWASHTVGMAIPGFDGLCAGVTVSAQAVTTRAPAEQWLRIREYDLRTDRILIEGVLRDDAGQPCCLGLIECFPFSPTPLPASAALAAQLGRRDTEDGAVVVVGGTRGAGGALTLALLARGRRVHAIHAASPRAAAELQALAGPRAHALTLHRLDAGDPAALASAAASLPERLEGIVLCAAPPPLPMTLTAETAAELSRYVEESVRLAATPLGGLAPRLRRDGGWIVVFSTATLQEPSREHPQLAAAKGAVEAVARAAAASVSAGLLVARVPRMRTDLVNTPGARLRAVPPETIAAEIADAVCGGSLEPGVTVITPTGAEVPVQ